MKNAGIGITLKYPLLQLMRQTGSEDTVSGCLHLAEVRVHDQLL